MSKNGKGSKNSGASNMPRITDAEWKVMNVFWDFGNATLREAFARLDDGTDWNVRTLQTLIRRLVKKGALLVEDENGREFRYAPAVSRGDCEMEESRSFLGRVFDGRLVPFMAGMVENEDLSREEIEELRRMLDEAARRVSEVKA